MLLLTSWQPKTLIDRFTWIMTLMIQSSASVKKEHGTIANALVVLMQKRFGKLRSAVTQAYARGPIPLRTRHQAAPRPNPATKPDPKLLPEYILPRCFGWALRMLPFTHIGAVQSQFKHLLTDPEMHALATTNRPVGSTLRALCHILGLKQPDYLRLPRRRKAANELSRKAADELSLLRSPGFPNLSAPPRHCEERSDVAIHSATTPQPRVKPPRRTPPPRPSPFPVAPPFPTPDQQKRAFREMFGDYQDSGRMQDFSPIDWTYIHPRE